MKLTLLVEIHVFTWHKTTVFESKESELCVPPPGCSPVVPTIVVSLSLLKTQSVILFWNRWMTCGQLQHGHLANGLLERNMWFCGFGLVKYSELLTREGYPQFRINYFIYMLSCGLRSRNC